MKSENVLLTICLVFIIVMLVGLIHQSLAMPDVHFSYSQDMCVQVINYAEGDNYSCENMPSKFNHVWVK